jgi:hypothetical protein
MRGVARVLKVTEQGIVFKHYAKRAYVMCSSSRKLIQKEELQGLNKSPLENNGITLANWHGCAQNWWFHKWITSCNLGVMLFACKDLRKI